MPKRTRTSIVRLGGGYSILLSYEHIFLYYSKKITISQRKDFIKNHNYGAENGGNKIEEKQYKIWISLINNLGIKKYRKLIKKFGSKKEIWNLSKSQIIKIGIDEKTAEMLTNLQIKQDIGRHINYMEKNKIEIISIEEKEYPKLLMQIPNPPINIYVKGNVKALNETNIAIIGCREATEYGKQIAQKISSQLATSGLNIVSGLARGIDSQAHLGALQVKKKTIAVVANGLDTIYPEENTKLAEQILEYNGSIISEYPLGVKAKKQYFPMRNRIISGLCNGILVVESKPKSGTLITVDFALEQGRDVFAIPGNIDSINSLGTNNLINQGAKLVTSYKDILEEYIK